MSWIPDEPADKCPQCGGAWRESAPTTTYDTLLGNGLSYRLTCVQCLTTRYRHVWGREAARRAQEITAEAREEARREREEYNRLLRQQDVTGVPAVLIGVDDAKPGNDTTVVEEVGLNTLAPLEARGFPNLLTQPQAEGDEPCLVPRSPGDGYGRSPLEYLPSILPLVRCAALAGFPPIPPELLNPEPGSGSSEGYARIQAQIFADALYRTFGPYFGTSYRVYAPQWKTEEEKRELREAVLRAAVQSDEQKAAVARLDERLRAIGSAQGRHVEVYEKPQAQKLIAAKKEPPQ